METENVGKTIGIRAAIDDLRDTFSIKWWAPISGQKELKTKYNPFFYNLIRAFLNIATLCTTEQSVL